MVPMPHVDLDLDAEVRSLYQGSAADFVDARKELARRLRQARDPRAAEVAALRKPGLSAWGVNQLFARETAAMRALVAAGVTARAAQGPAAAGGDRAALRESLAAIRNAVARLAARGAELLGETERAPGEAIVERLRTNLESLALDPGAGPVAAREWLDLDLEPPSFEVLAALQVAAAAPPARPAASGPVATGPSASTGGSAGRRQAAAEPPARLATVHAFDEARARREQEAQQRRERERRERLERLAADAARADEEAARQRRAAEGAERDAVEAERAAAIAAEKAVAARAAVGHAQTRAEKAAAAAAKAREALAAVLGES
jgi:hypothetical protein